MKLLGCKMHEDVGSDASKEHILFTIVVVVIYSVIKD